MMDEGEESRDASSEKGDAVNVVMVDIRTRPVRPWVQLPCGVLRKGQECRPECCHEVNTMGVPACL